MRDNEQRSQGDGVRFLLIETEAVNGFVLERLAERFFAHAITVTPSLWVDPLLVDLSRLNQLAQRYRCGLSVTTQGLALTRSCFESLRGGLAHIEVLIHSPRRDVWDFCGRGREFSRVTQNVRRVAPLARADGVRLGLSIFSAEWNRAGVDEAVAFAESLGAGALTILPLRRGRCRGVGHMGPAELKAMQRAELDLLAYAAERAATRGLVLLGRDGLRHRSRRNESWPFPSDRSVPLIESSRLCGGLPGIGSVGRPTDRSLRVTKLGRLEAGGSGEKIGHLLLVPVASRASRPLPAGLSGA